MTDIILKDQTYYTPDEADLIAWQQAYPNCDVHAELAAMASWCDANPQKRKTSRGAKAFVNNWLNRANKGGGSPFAQKSQGHESDLIVRTRDMSTTDDLADNFTGDPEIRALFIEKYGYSFEGGKRVTA